MEGPRVDCSQGYNLRSGRRVEYESPLVSRVPRSPARVVNKIEFLGGFKSIICESLIQVRGWSCGREFPCSVCTYVQIMKSYKEKRRSFLRFNESQKVSFFFVTLV